MSDRSRRQFLRDIYAVTAAASIPTAANLSAITRAAAQTAGGDYKALVCVFLNGGNDAYNTVLATDSGSWQDYRYQRDAQSRNAAETGTGIALMSAGTSPNPGAARGSAENLGGVLPIQHAGRSVHAGRSFALHPCLTNVRRLHQAGTAAVLANVGPLTRPTSKSDVDNPLKSKPQKLYSHNDQQSCWQSFLPEGAPYGWGGRMGDALIRNALSATQNDSDEALALKLFTCQAPGNSSVWLTGQQIRPFQSSGTAILSLGQNQAIYGNTRLHDGIAAVLGNRASSVNKFATEHANIATRALKASRLLGAKLPDLGVAPWSTSGVTNVYSDAKLQFSNPVTGTQAFNPLALQLQMVARLIEANRVSGLGLKRQLFFVSLGSFDHHDRLMSDHAERLAQLDHALGYFDAVLGSMPGGDLRSQVTTFTASEFGRTFTSNGDGTDHGWGGHHFIMGGAVRGTEVYGTFPTYSSADSRGVFSSPDQLRSGVLLPSTSVDQYAYTLGRWMGVSSSDLLTILPALSQFDSGVRDLGFMRV